jgi:DNA modification methylase
MTTGRVIVLRGDARALPLPDASVDLIVTSPPYFGLRSYTDGGEHYEGQIGSEATPQEWLAALVACTAEWMRVLKPEGSMFVNLGDSYAGSAGGGAPSASSTLAGNGHVGGGPKLSTLGRGERPRRPMPRGVQFTREDAAWLAGVIDSDGSISVRINQQAEGNAPSFVPWVRVGQMRPEVVTRIAELVGTGKVMHDGRGVWHWTAAAQQARWVLERIHPWLLIKKRQAWAAIEVARHVEDRNAKGSWRQLTDDDIAYRQRLRAAVLAWNKGEPDDMPVPEPRPVALPVYPLAPRAKSLYGLPHLYAEECVGRLGLIKRAEIVWSKPNGLPESVQDRVRRSHEILFHFTRSPRYYSAVDEIREEQAADPGVRGLPKPSRHAATPISGTQWSTANRLPAHPLGKLPGSVWDIPSQPLTVPARLGVDHFAAYPFALVRPIILGWSPPGVCVACGQGRRPVVATSYEHINNVTNRKSAAGERLHPGVRTQRTQTVSRAQTAITGYVCACTPHTDHPGTGETSGDHYSDRPGEGIATGRYPNSGANWGGKQDLAARPRTGPWREYHHDQWTPPPTRPAVVLDPFSGTGTTSLVASALGRIGIGVDRSADYTRLARWRTTDPGERAKALQVPKPPPIPDGMEALF